MARLIKRIAVLTLGWLFILFGIVGLVLPVLQGVLFLLIGLALLSTESETARLLLERVRGHFPRLSERIEIAEERALQWWNRITRRRDDAAG